MINISQFVKETKSGSVLEHTHKIIEEIEKKNKKFHHLNSFDKKSVIEQAEQLEKQKQKGKLFGVPISVKDCVCVEGLESRAGSKILSGYKPVFDATVIAKAKKEGAIILGKTSQDEFGFGTFSTNHTAGENPKNPFDDERSCGGSSGGAAGFTALTKNTHAAIAESTGGSIACPASFCGVASITPTYGMVSRFGLMDYANSLDKIGSMGKTIEDASVLLEVMSGNDPKDSTSLKDASIKNQDVKGLKIGLPKELFKSIQDEKLKEIVRKKIDKAESFGAKIEEISLPLNTEYGVAVYYLIAMAEASTNLAKYCGLRYGFEKKIEGNFNEYFSSVRSEAFGEEAKRRIIIGTFARMSGFRDAYYLRAMKARTKLINEYKSIFKKVDLLAMPAMPIVAPKFKEIEKLSPLQHYQMDLCTVSPNLCGLPHATINAGFLKELPVGLMLAGNHLEDGKVISAAKKLEGSE
tara:strand:+ start:1173 stop:2570 length:1398 start_codon:yes stop_codon:yes gene_type:complete